MRRMSWDDPMIYEVCKEVLAAGGVVLHPTETCYGLAVDVFNDEALDKLYALKQMPKSKPVSVLVSDLAMAQRFGEFSAKALELARRYWPGPLSIRVKRRTQAEGGLPDFVNFGEETVALRCSGMDFCKQMVEQFEGPVSTTSANVSGEVQAYSLEDLSEEFLLDIDLVVDGGMIERRSPSTIVDIEGENVKILRQGDLQISL